MTTINGTDYVPALNGTLINKDFCTNSICSLEYAELLYIPTFAGNLAYLIIFVLLLVAHVGLGCYYRTWTYLVGLACGLILEIAGYAGRILMHGNIFEFNYFVIYLVCLTIAPAFISAAIYLCLSRLIIFHGRDIARFSPKVYTYVFIGCDVVSLILQASGGALAAIGDSGSSMSSAGVNIMIAGLSWQVVSLVLFALLSLDVFWSIRKMKHTQLRDSFTGFKNTTMFRLFPWALAFATLVIFIRCCFRVAELKDGFNGSLANNQTMFMIFEGPMVAAAALALAVFHPGFCCGGSEGWKAQPQFQDKMNSNSELTDLTYSNVTA